MKQVEPLFNCQVRRNLSENEIALNQAMMEVWRLKKEVAQFKMVVEENKRLREENRLLLELVGLLGGRH